MSYKIIDLFCGAGGMTLGFVEPRFYGGFRCVLAVDSDRSSIATHHSNFGGRVVCRSIEEWLEADPWIPQGKASATAGRSGRAYLRCWVPRHPGAGGL